jgi:DNA-binding HxlR family transcriptional regulator
MSKLKRKGKSKFIMIEAYVKRSAAWKALTPIERNAYIEIKWRYDGTNNGRIGLGCRELGDEINMSRDTAARALDGLQEKGFVVKAKASAFSVKNRVATEWRLTEFACDVTGNPATKDFMRWGFEKKPQSHAPDKQSHPSDTLDAEQCGLPPHSRTHLTVKPISGKPQSHPSDTYRYTMGGRTDA